MLLLRFFRQRTLDWLTGQHLVAHRSLVDEAGYDDRNLFQIVGLQAVIDIHIGMVSARLVLYRILDELEPRNADGVERKMVGAARIAHGQRGHAEIAERLHPRFEDRSDGLVLLQINTPDLSRAIV